MNSGILGGGKRICTFELMGLLCFYTLGLVSLMPGVFSMFVLGCIVQVSIRIFPKLEENRGTRLTVREY